MKVNEPQTWKPPELYVTIQHVLHSKQTVSIIKKKQLFNAE